MARKNCFTLQTDFRYILWWCSTRGFFCCCGQYSLLAAGTCRAFYLWENATSEGVSAWRRGSGSPMAKGMPFSMPRHYSMCLQTIVANFWGAGWFGRFPGPLFMEADAQAGSKGQNLWCRGNIYVPPLSTWPYVSTAQHCWQTPEHGFTQLNPEITGKVSGFCFCGGGFGGGGLWISNLLLIGVQNN